MIFSLDIRRARKGDCFLLHYGTKTAPGLAIIDGGPANVYQPHLKPRLNDVRTARKPPGNPQLEVDLLMVSHIDDDHIKGILELTDELVQAKNAGQLLPLKVRSFWHNSFDDIIGNDPAELLASVTASLGTASLAGEIDSERVQDPHALLVMASVAQGVRLRDDAKKLNFPKNPEFGKKLIMAKKGSGATDMKKGLTFTVAGPMQKELEALQKIHAEFLAKPKSKKAEAALAAFTDSSVPNLSSIVVLAEAGGKKMLLTGDARGDKILEGLELVGRLTPTEPLKVDILKMPHHGSDRNIDPILFKRIKADHYVFSGDGEHGNPERETLEMLLNDRADEAYTVHLTYTVAEIDAQRKVVWEEEQAKKKKKGKPTEAWSPKKHSVQALLNANKAFAKKVSEIKTGETHVINLLDQIDF